tara:strand:+ start:204 stop:323 length:120 start_codon:yes stop_codon:yes gene_type:complete
MPNNIIMNPIIYSLMIEAWVKRKEVDYVNIIDFHDERYT